MLFLCASENRTRFTAARRFFFYNLPVLRDTHIPRLSEASGRTLPREVVGAVAGVDDLSIYCRARQVAADSRNAGLDLQLGAIMSRGVVPLLGCTFLLMVPRELTYT